MTREGVDRTDPKWQRLRTAIGAVNSTEVDPDEQTDVAYLMSRRKWKVEEELAAELNDTVETERAKSRGRDGKRRKKAQA